MPKKTSNVVPFPTVQKAREKKAKPEPQLYQWLCQRCKHDIGVASSEILQVRLSPIIQGLKIVGGYKSWVCAKCYQRGITTKVLL